MAVDLGERPPGYLRSHTACVRDWGKVVLSAAGQPLIVAGEYGQGRVIRSGRNLILPANDNQNDVGRAESAEALWEQLAESGELPSANAQDAERMIARWRRDRDGDEIE